MTRASEPRRLGGWRRGAGGRSRAPRSPSPSLALGPALGLANPRPAGPLPSRGAACEPVGSGCAGLRGPARGIGRLSGGVLRGRGGLRPLTLAPAPRVSLPACLTPAGPTLAPDSPAVPWAPTGLGAAPPVLSLCEARVAPLLSPPPLPRSVCPPKAGALEGRAGLAPRARPCRPCQPGALAAAAGWSQSARAWVSSREGVPVWGPRQCGDMALSHAGEGRDRASGPGQLPGPALRPGHRWGGAARVRSDVGPRRLAESGPRGLAGPASGHRGLRRVRRGRAPPCVPAWGSAGGLVAAEVRATNLWSPRVTGAAGPSGLARIPQGQAPPSGLGVCSLEAPAHCLSSLPQCPPGALPGLHVPLRCGGVGSGCSTPHGLGGAGCGVGGTSPQGCLWPCRVSLRARPTLLSLGWCPAGPVCCPP